MNEFPVAVSSFGCVSAAGAGLGETSSALREGRSGIGPVTRFSVAGRRASTAGQVEDSRLTALAKDVFRPARRWPRAAQLTLVAMAEALAGRPGFRPDAVIVGTTSGGMDLGEEFFRAIARGGDSSSAGRRVRGYPPQAPAAEALRVFGVSAPIRVVSNACASGTNALGMGWRMIRSGRARRVLAGGYDALCRMVFAGFDCLQASTPELCRPFDAGRSGLALGEGAAFFCLESEGPERIAGYGAATDTHHLTQPNPTGEGPRAAMRAALAAAERAPEDIGLVNAHGTATPQNDACEALAIASVCPAAPVVSTKAVTGHALGAAGAIEAAFCLLALRDRLLPATLNFRSPDPGLELDIISGTARMADPRVAISNSFGFGGANASLVFERS